MTRRIKKKAKSPVKISAEGRAAVVGVDPGGTTGVFGGVVELGATMYETVQLLERNSLLILQTKGDFKQQARAISAEVGRWLALLSMDGLRKDRQYLIIEDFVLRRRQEGGATGNLTSIWVAAALDTRLGESGLDGQIMYRQASDAKSYATNDRLKMWGLYELTKGKPHARDASRHWAWRVNKLIE